jgi:chaperonin cofactor prefoldin
MESLRTSAMSHKEEVDNLKSKLSNSKVRCDVLEKTVKDSKNQFALKMKVLIDKTENDDKLIGMLKAEIAKLESSKGVKSSLNLGSRGAG